MVLLEMEQTTRKIRRFLENWATHNIARGGQGELIKVVATQSTQEKCFVLNSAWVRRYMVSRLEVVSNTRLEVLIMKIMYS